ncbi:cell adhesion molecule CEACAM2-like [Rhinoderma darwinii]|uniref:cell adhesion molecule CEACAM2-like n=1 Tax=Rhinoderma darwinii TaxID=43563 RepID=UPI003F67ED72
MWIWMISVFPYMWLDAAYGMPSIQLIPQYPVINGSLTLNVTGITENILNFIWYNGTKSETPYQILRYIPSYSPILFRGPLYNPRITAFRNGSLHIRDLHITDRGNYIVKIQTVMSSQDINVTLTVYELVRKPVITSSHCPIQEDDLYVLTCVTADAEKITWSRNNNSLPDGANMSGDARTVTFANIKHSDAGGYQCEAENRVSKKISDIFTVSVLNIPEGTTGANPIVIAGIVCGTILSIILIISVTFLLYQIHILPLREAKKALSADKQDPSEIYDNVLVLTSDLQCKPENVYNEIIR